MLKVEPKRWSNHAHTHTKKKMGKISFLFSPSILFLHGMMEIYILELGINMVNFLFLIFFFFYSCDNTKTQIKKNILWWLFFFLFIRKVQFLLENSCFVFGMINNNYSLNFFRLWTFFQLFSPLTLLKKERFSLNFFRLWAYWFPGIQTYLRS